MTSSEKVIGLRVAGVCGVLSPIVALSLIFLAITYSPWFSWTKNALSDLGVDGLAAILFNSGLIISGLLAIVFSLGLMQALRKQMLGFAGSFVLVLACISLVGVGVFPETAGPIHFYLSVAFFALILISQFLIAAAMISESSKRNIGLFSVLVGLLGTVSIAMSMVLPLEGAAIPEILASFSASLWSIILGVRLFARALK